MKVGLREMLLKRKRLGDYTCEELEKRSTLNLAMFWGYVVTAVVIMGVGSYTSWNILRDLMGVSTDGVTKLTLILLVFNVINFFSIFWVWLITETNYYKMEQEFSELMLYLRNKEFEA